VESEEVAVPVDPPRDTDSKASNSPVNACRPAPRRPLFVTAVMLTVVLVICKLLSLLPARGSVEALLSDLFVAVHADLGFVVGSGMVALVLLVASRRWPRIERMLWVSWLVYSAACVAYAIISYRIYTLIYTPLTYRFFAVEGAGDAWSSVKQGTTVGIVIALIVVTTTYVALAQLATRVVAQPQGQVPRRRRFISLGLQTIVVLATIITSFEGRERHLWQWRARYDASVAYSPHVALGRGLFRVLAGSHLVGHDAGWDEGVLVRIQDLGHDYPPEYESDFAPQPAGKLPSLGTPPPRNVVIYVLESVGAEYLDPYGSPYGVTPRIAEAAAHAAVFDDISVQIGKTDGSLVSMFLSTYLPLSHRMVSDDMPRVPGTTLAQVLAARGSRTAFITASSADYGGQLQFLASRGFQRSEDYATLGCEEVSSWGAADRCMVDNLLQWIDEEPQRPFFAVGWTNQTHHPYAVTPGTPVKRYEYPPLPRQLGDFNAYLNALSEADREFGRLLDGLRDRGLEEDTLLVITADHPESFGVHHPTFLHGFNVYQEDVRVPLIIVDKRRYATTERIATLGSIIDINPTIAQWVGAPTPGDWQGRSLFDPNRSDRVYYFATHANLVLGVREGSWKYILNLSTGNDQLFDLASDPHEQVNLADREPQRRTRLRQRMAAWMRAQKRRYRQGEMTLAP